MAPPSPPPTITIVIPAYNAARYLSQTLDSVLKQTFNDWQCLIVDDGSTDDTPSIAQDYANQDPRFTAITQPNAGVAAARNLGAEAASSTPFLIFLDADDVWYPEALQTLLARFHDHPKAPAVHGHGSYLGPEGQCVRPGELEAACRSRLLFNGHKVINTTASQPTTFQTLATACSIWTPGMVLIRTQAFQKITGFDAQLHLTEDWDLWVRLSRLGDIPFVDHPVIHYRQHTTNSSSNKLKSMLNVALARRKIMTSPDNTPAQRRFAKRSYRAFYLFMAKGRLRNFPFAFTGLLKKENRVQCLLGWINLSMGLTGKLGNIVFIRLCKRR